jgi:hypothetical protein
LTWKLHSDIPLCNEEAVAMHAFQGLDRGTVAR